MTKIEQNPFADVPVLGGFKLDAAIEKLRELGDPDAATELATSKENARRQELPQFALSSGWPWRPRMWQFTSHAIGFIPPRPAERQEIVDASSFAPDARLKGAHLKISLGEMQIADYPGGATHHVLLACSARNQLAARTQALHWNATLKVANGAHAAVRNFPLITGVEAGTEGLAFSFLTVNVRNEEDEKFLHFLDSDEFKQGLLVAGGMHPALGPLVKMAEAVARRLANRHRNVPVQNVHVGFDFGGTAFGARLREGSYVVVQVPEALERVWDWSDWSYQGRLGRIMRADNEEMGIPYNYLVFNITRVAS